ncbi:MAG TPA: hypothetical protein VFC51_10775 [Chloroflexota bacterium]|nr:hypothetical protein [Chloroflexota bacterium]
MSDGFRHKFPHVARPTRDNLARVAALDSARAIADAADADQYAIAVAGLPGLGPPDFEELVPRAHLTAMNEGRPAAYRMTIVLKVADADLGVVRLGTVRPSGFSVEDVRRARCRAAVESQALATTLGRLRSARSCVGRSPKHRARPRVA